MAAAAAPRTRDGGGGHGARLLWGRRGLEGTQIDEDRAAMNSQRRCPSPTRGREVGDTTDKEGPPVSVIGSGPGRQPERERGQRGARGVCWATGLGLPAGREGEWAAEFAGPRGRGKGSGELGGLS